MAILYAFTITNPNDVDIFPPSVMNSEWCNNLTLFVTNKRYITNPIESVFGNNNLYDVFLFNDQSDYDSFVSTYKLTDPTLIADIETWKSIHNINYEHRIYNLTDNVLVSTSIL